MPQIPTPKAAKTLLQLFQTSVNAVDDRVVFTELHSIDRLELQAAKNDLGALLNENGPREWGYHLDISGLELRIQNLEDYVLDVADVSTAQITKTRKVKKAARYLRININRFLSGRGGRRWVGPM